jgi:endonuclease YncB( thermonuclease family)
LKQQFNKYDINSTPHFTLNGNKMWGRVVSLYDGDTLTISLNVFNNMFKFSVRMSGIDTCEIKSKNDKNKELACYARSRLLSLITDKDVSEMSLLNDRRKINNYLNKNVYMVWVECLEFDKYGRLLANIYNDNENNIVGIDGNSFSAILIREKLAYEYKGDTKMTEEEQVKCLKL